MSHVEMHRAIILANCGHNPGCNSTTCPLRAADRVRTWPWLEAVNLAVAAVGFWVAVIFPLWMAAELEDPGQQYADPVLPVFYCAALFAGPTIPAVHIWRLLVGRKRGDR